MELKKQLHPILTSFLPSKNLVGISPITEGLINATYKIDCLENQEITTYILQKINTAVFSNPDAIQQNILAVKSHLEHKKYPFETLTLLKDKKGASTHFHEGEAWRMLHAIPNCYTLSVVQNESQAYQVGAFFGQFHKALEGQNLKTIQPVLPDFLNLATRISAFENALKQAPQHRKDTAKTEISWLVANKNIPMAWIAMQKETKLPLRLIHADPKISNVLFDTETQLPKAIIDWDTLMVGSILYDYADMIRSYTNTKKEDDPDPENVFSEAIYTALTRGFLAETASILTPIEHENLAYSARVIVYIQALRFLTDYLNGNVYYHCSYENQNLYRTRNQINLLKCLMKI